MSRPFPVMILLLALVALPVLATPPDDGEVRLQTRRFIGSQPQRAVADFLRDLGAPRQVTGELSAVRAIAFYDTADTCALRSRGLHLRREVGDDPRRETLHATSDGLATDEPLVVVNDLEIEERVYEATWEGPEGPVRLSVVLWYTEPPTRPLVARVRGGEDAVVAAVRELPQWVEPDETTAMDIVYRGFCEW